MTRLRHIEIPEITRSEYEQRVERLRTGMRQQKVDLAVLLYPADILYFSGVGFLSIMIIPLDGEPVLLVQINEKRARKETWVDDVRPSYGLPTMQELLLDRGFSKATIGTELDVIPVNLFHRIERLLPEAKFVDISPSILEVRLIKSSTEIEIIRRHGLGLEIDEPPLVGPKADLIIQPGMVISFEPKIMIPGWGGVDVEDTMVVTEHGADVLTRTDRKLWVV